MVPCSALPLFLIRYYSCIYFIALLLINPLNKNDILVSLRTPLERRTFSKWVLLDIARPAPPIHYWSYFGSNHLLPELGPEPSSIDDLIGRIFFFLGAAAAVVLHVIRK